MSYDFPPIKIDLATGPGGEIIRRRALLIRRPGARLDIALTIHPWMKGPFRGLYARAFAHATEDLEKVKTAMENALGPQELKILKTEGVHGNPIVILEAEISDPQEVPRFLSRLSREDLETILRTLDNRVDEGCNLFIKLDKQSAFGGLLRLDQGDDVISVRIRVAAFPAKREVAMGLISEVVEQYLAGRDGDIHRDS